MDFMEFQLIGSKPDGFMHYLVKVKPNSDHYIIEDQMVEEWLQYDSQLPASDFFEAMNALDIEEIIPAEKCAWYFIDSNANLADYSVEKQKKYLISGDQLIEITDEQLPIKGYYLTTGGFKKVSESKTVGVEEVDYFFKLVS